MHAIIFVLICCFVVSSFDEELKDVFKISALSLIGAVFGLLLVFWAAIALLILAASAIL